MTVPVHGEEHRRERNDMVTHSWRQSIEKVDHISEVNKTREEIEERWTNLIFLYNHQK